MSRQNFDFDKIVWKFYVPKQFGAADSEKYHTCRFCSFYGSWEVPDELRNLHPSAAAQPSFFQELRASGAMYSSVPQKVFVEACRGALFGPRGRVLDNGLVVCRRLLTKQILAKWMLSISCKMFQILNWQSGNWQWQSEKVHLHVAKRCEENRKYWLWTGGKRVNLVDLEKCFFKSYPLGQITATAKRRTTVKVSVSGGICETVPGASCKARWDLSLYSSRVLTSSSYCFIQCHIISLSMIDEWLLIEEWEEMRISRWRWWLRWLPGVFLLSS